MSSPLKEMAPEEIRQLLEGQRDILSPRVREELAFLEEVACPYCGATELAFYIDARRPFSGNGFLPRKLLRCACGAEIEPYSNILLKQGGKSK